MTESWHALTAEEVLGRLGSDPEKGLSTVEAEKRLAAHGPNRLAEKKPPSALKLFFDQLNNFIVWVLIAAALVAGFLGEVEDCVAGMSSSESSTRSRPLARPR